MAIDLSLLTPLSQTPAPTEPLDGSPDLGMLGKLATFTDPSSGFQDTSLAPAPEPSYNILGKSMTRKDLEQYDAGNWFLQTSDAEKQGIRGFGEAITDFRRTDVPMIGDVLGVAGILKVGKDYKRIADGEDVSDEDRIKVAAYLQDQERNSMEGVGGMVGDVLRQMPWFAAEIGAYSLAAGVATAEIGGVGAVAGAAVGVIKAGVTAGARTIARTMVNKGFKGALAKAVEAGAGKTFASDYARNMARLKLSGRVTEGLAGRAAGSVSKEELARLGKMTLGDATADMLTRGTAVTLMDTAVNAGMNILQGENALESNRSAMERTQNLIAGEDEDENMSRMIGLGDRAIEYLSEMSGPVIGAAFAPLGRKVAKMTGRAEGESLLEQIKRTYYGADGELAGSPAAKAAADKAFKAGALGTILQSISKAKLIPLDESFKVLKASGYHGWLEEIGEERVGDFLRGYLGIQSDEEGNWGLANALQQAIPSPDQLKTEAIAFALPGLFVSAVHRGQLHLKGNVSQMEAAMETLVAAGKPDYKKNETTGKWEVQSSPIVSVMNGKVLESSKPRSETTRPDVDQVIQAIEYLESRRTEPQNMFGQILGGLMGVTSKIATGNMLGIHEGDAPIDDLLAIHGVPAYTDLYRKAQDNSFEGQGTTRKDFDALPEGEQKAKYLEESRNFARRALAPFMSDLRESLVIPVGVMDMARESALKENPGAPVTNEDMVRHAQKLADEGSLVQFKHENGAITYSIKSTIPTQETVANAVFRALKTMNVTVANRPETTVDATKLTTEGVRSLIDLSRSDIEPQDLLDIATQPYSEKGQRLSQRLHGGATVDWKVLQKEARELYTSFMAANVVEYKNTVTGNTYLVRTHPKDATKRIVSATSVAAHNALVDNDIMSADGVDKEREAELFGTGAFEPSKSLKVSIVNPIAYQHKDPVALVEMMGTDYGAIIYSPGASPEQMAKQAGAFLKSTFKAVEDTKSGLWTVTPGGLNDNSQIAFTLNRFSQRTLKEETIESALRRVGGNTPVEFKTFKNDVKGLVGKSKGEGVSKLSGVSEGELISHTVTMLGYGFEEMTGAQKADIGPIYAEINALKDEIMKLPSFGPMLREAAKLQGIYDFKKDQVDTAKLSPLLNPVFTRGSGDATKDLAGAATHASILGRWAGKPAAPAAGKPDAGKPDAGKPDAGKPSASKVDMNNMTAENLKGMSTAEFLDLETTVKLFGVDAENALVDEERKRRDEFMGPQMSILDSNSATQFLITDAARKAHMPLNDDDWKLFAKGDPAVRQKITALLVDRRLPNISKKEIEAALDRYARGIVEPLEAAEKALIEAQEAADLALLSTTFRQVESSDDPPTPHEEGTMIADYLSYATRVAQNFENATKVVAAAAHGILGAGQVKGAIRELAQEMDSTVLGSQEAFDKWASTPVATDTPAMRLVRDTLVSMPVASAVNLIYKSRKAYNEPALTFVDGKYLISIDAERSRKEVMEDHKQLVKILMGKSEADVESMRADGAALPNYAANSMPEQPEREAIVKAAQDFMAKHFGQRFADIILPEFSSVIPYRHGSNEITPWQKFGYFYSKLLFDYGNRNTRGVSKSETRMNDLLNPATKAKSARILASAFSAGYLIGSEYKSDGTLEALRNSGNAMHGVFPSSTRNPGEGKTSNLHMDSHLRATIDELGEGWSHVVVAGSRDGSYANPLDANEMSSADIINIARTVFKQGTAWFPIIANDKMGFMVIQAPAGYVTGFDSYEEMFAGMSEEIMPKLMGSAWGSISPAKLNKRLGPAVAEGPTLITGIPGGLPDAPIKTIVFKKMLGMNGGVIVTSIAKGREIAVSAGRVGDAVASPGTGKFHVMQVVDGVLTMVKANWNLQPNLEEDGYEKMLVAAVEAATPGVAMIMTDDSAKYHDESNPITVNINGEEVTGYLVDLLPDSAREVASLDQVSRPKHKHMPVTFLKDFKESVPIFARYVALRLKGAVARVAGTVAEKDKTQVEQVWADAGLPTGNPSTIRGRFYAVASALANHFEMKGHVIKSTLVASGGSYSKVTKLTTWIGGKVDPILRGYGTMADGALVPITTRENNGDRRYRTNMIVAPADMGRAQTLIREIVQAVHHAGMAVGHPDVIKSWKKKERQARENLEEIATDFAGNSIPTSWSFMDTVTHPDAPSFDLDDYVFDKVFAAENNKISGTLNTIHRTPAGGINAHAVAFLGGYVNWTTEERDGKLYTIAGTNNVLKVHPEVEDQFGLDFDGDANTTHLPEFDRETRLINYDMEQRLPDDATDRQKDAAIETAYSNNIWQAITGHIRGLTREQATEAIETDIFDAITRPGGETVLQASDRKAPGHDLSDVRKWSILRDETLKTASSRDLFVSFNGSFQLGTTANYSKLAFGHAWESVRKGRTTQHAAPALINPATGGETIKTERKGPNPKSDAFLRKAMVDVINIIIDDPAKAGALGLARETLPLFAGAMLGQTFGSRKNVFDFVQSWVNWAASPFGEAYATAAAASAKAHNGFSSDKEVATALQKEGFPSDAIDAVQSLKHVTEKVVSVGRLLNTFDRIPTSPGELASFRKAVRDARLGDPAVDGITETMRLSPLGNQVAAVANPMQEAFELKGDSATMAAMTAVEKALGRDAGTLVGDSYDKAAKAFRTAALADAAWQMLPEDLRIALTHTVNTLDATITERTLTAIHQIFFNGIKKYLGTAAGEPNGISDSLMSIDGGLVAKLSADMTVDEYAALLAEAPAFAKEIVSANPSTPITETDVMPLLAFYSYAKTGYEGTVTSGNTLYLVAPATIKSVMEAAGKVPVAKLLPDVVDGKYPVKRFRSSSLLKDAALTMKVVSIPTLEAAVGKLKDGLTGEFKLYPASIEILGPATFSAAQAAAEASGTLMTPVSEYEGKKQIIYPAGTPLVKDTPYVFKPFRGGFPYRVIPGASTETVDLDKLRAGPVAPAKEAPSVLSLAAKVATMAPMDHRAKEVAKARAAKWVIAAPGYTGSYASNLSTTAKSSNILVTNANVDAVQPGDRIYVSIPGYGRTRSGKAFNFQDNAEYSNIPKLLDKGAIILTDNEANATRAHNAGGEGLLRKSLLSKGYVETTKQGYSEWSKAATQPAAAQKPLTQEVKESESSALTENSLISKLPSWVQEVIRKYHRTSLQMMGGVMSQKEFDAGLNFPITDQAGLDAAFEAIENAISLTSGIEAEDAVHALRRATSLPSFSILDSSDTYGALATHLSDAATKHGKFYARPFLVKAMKDAMPGIIKANPMNPRNQAKALLALPVWSEQKVVPTDTLDAGQIAQVEQVFRKFQDAKTDEIDADLKEQDAAAIVAADAERAGETSFSIISSAVSPSGVIEMHFAWRNKLLAIPDRVRKLQTLPQLLDRAQLPRDEKNMLLEYAKTSGKTDLTDLVDGFEKDVLKPLAISPAKATWDGNVETADVYSGQNYERLSVNRGQGQYSEYFIKTPFAVPGQHGSFTDPNLAGWFRVREYDGKDIPAPATFEEGDATPYVEQNWNGEWFVESEGTPIHGPFTTEEEAYSVLSHLRPVTAGQKGIVEINEIQSELFQKNKGGFSSGEYLQFNPYVVGTADWESFERGFAQMEDRDTNRSLYAYDKNQAAFLNLLVKDQNWVPVFVQSIMKWAEGKGFSKVRFPTGETAAKVEGHQVLADQLVSLQQAKADTLEKQFTPLTEAMWKEDQLYYATPMPFADWLTLKQEDFNKRRDADLASIDKRISELKSQGIEKLAPIETFYQNRVGAIVKKMGAELVTDANGNTWMEVPTRAGEVSFSMLDAEAHAKFFGEAPSFSLLSSLDSVAESAASERHAAMGDDIRNAAKVPDVKKALLKDWAPLQKQLESAKTLDEALAAVEAARKSIKSFSAADAISMKEQIIKEFNPPGSSSLETLANSKLARTSNPSALEQATAAERLDKPVLSNSPTHMSILSWQEAYGTGVLISTEYGTPGLARILMRESGNATALLEKDDVRNSHWMKIFGLWGNDRRIMQITRKKVPYSKNPGETRPPVELIKFANTKDVGPGFTEAQHQELLLSLDLLHEALSQLPGIGTLDDKAARDAIGKASLLLPVPILEKTDAAGRAMLEALVPKKIVDQMLAKRDAVRAKVRKNMGHYRMVHAAAISGKAWEGRADHEVQEHIIALEYFANGVGVLREVTKANGKKTLGETRWLVPGAAVLEHYEKETDGPRQALLDAGRTAEEISLPKLLLDVHAAYTSDFNEMKEGMPHLMQRGDLPYLRFHRSFGPRSSGTGFLGANEQEYLKQINKALTMTTEPQAAVHRVMNGVAYDKKTGEVRPLEEVSEGMFQVLFNLKGMADADSKRGAADIQAGKYVDQWLDPDMNYADVVDAIHDLLITRMAQRMQDRAVKMTEPMGASIPNPIALLRETTALKKEKNYRHREAARATQRRQYSSNHEAYRVGGVMPANTNILEAQHRYVSQMATTTMHATMLNQFVLASNTDGTPIVIAEPSTAYTGTGIIRDVTWEEQAKKLADLIGVPLDPALTAKQNVKKLIESHVSNAGNKNYVRVDSSYDSIANFYVFVRPGGAEPVVDVLASGLKGGEAVNMLSQVLNSPWTDPWDALAWVEAANNRMKVAAMQASGFFPVSAVESVIAAAGRRAFKQIPGMSRKLPTYVEIYDMWVGGHPEYAHVMRLMAKQSSVVSRSGNPLEIPTAVMDRDIAAIDNFIKEKFGRDTAHSARWVTHIPQMQARMIFEKIFNTTKVWMMMDRISFERENALKNDLPIPSDAEIVEKWAHTVDMAMGGDNVWRTSYFTPTVVRMLNLLMFSRGWTKAAWDIAGGGLLTAPFLKNHLKPYESKFIFLQNWPAMAFYVLFLIPAMMQASAWALAAMAGGAGGGDDDDDKDKNPDTPWMWQNETDRQLYADITPLARMSPLYKGAPTGQRRFYIHFGKQAYETVDGWLQDPWKTFTGKLSQVARLGIEQATGQSAGSSYDLGFKDQGLAGLIFDKDGGFSGSRIGMLGQKFAPFSILAMAQNPDVSPVQAFAPVSKGMSFSKASTAYYDLLKTWAYKDSYSKIYKSQRIQANLEALGGEILNAAERNGYDRKKVVDAARAAILKELYASMFKALDAKDTGKIEEIGRSISRVNGTLMGAMRSVQSRDKLYGRGNITPEQREALRQAFSNP